MKAKKREKLREESNWSDTGEIVIGLCRMGVGFGSELEWGMNIEEVEATVCRLLF